MLTNNTIKERLSITIEPVNKLFLQEFAEQKEQSMSETVDHILTLLRDKYIEEEMKKGYIQMADEDLKIAREFDSIIPEIIFALQND